MDAPDPLFLGAGPILAGAAALGLVAGYCFYRIWRRLLPVDWTRSLRRRLPGEVRAMLACEDPSEMLRHYRSVLLGIGAYAGRNSLGLMLGLAPVAAVFLALSAFDPSGRLADEAEAYPPEAVGDAGDGPSPAAPQATRVLVDREAFTKTGPTIGGLSLGGAAFADKHAYCRPGLNCLLFEMLLFETHPDGAGRQSGPPIVVRPAVLDSNPFWPYVNDAEFWFFLATMLGGGAAAWRRNKAGADGR